VVEPVSVLAEVAQLPAQLRMRGRQAIAGLGGQARGHVGQLNGPGMRPAAEPHNPDQYEDSL